MRIAFIYDRVNKIGGAERVLTALHAIWPDAPLFTSVYDPKRAPWARDFDVRTTFLQHIPFAKNHHELFPWLTPLAFQTLRFDGYDVVLSVTSAEAKGVITKPETMHICYCLTPTRYLWSGADEYVHNPGFGPYGSFIRFFFSLWMPRLRMWDQVAASRPDRYIAISERVRKRIETYYRRTCDRVIYPPVDTDFFTPSPGKTKNDYYLYVSRLVPYKRADIVVRACTDLKKNLIVIGDGMERRALQKMAGPMVTFVPGNLTDTELLGYYRNCRAFLYAADEDFGIAPAEAQSCGKPVIAFAKSGVSEIVKDRKTGILYHRQTEQSLKDAIIVNEQMVFDDNQIRIHALRFSTLNFQKNIRKCVETAYQAYQHTL